MNSDPAFQRTRENGQEFGRAGSSGKMIRVAFRSLLLNSDNRIVDKLVKELLKVIQSAPISTRGGLRKASNGNLGLLVDFEFNIRAPLTSTLFAPYMTAIDSQTRISSVGIASFSKSEMLQAPGTTSLFKIVGGSSN